VATYFMVAVCALEMPIVLVHQVTNKCVNWMVVNSSILF